MRIKSEKEKVGRQMETAFVVEKTIELEESIASIISQYFHSNDIDKNIVFRNIVLNNAIISLSSKIKLYRHINSIENDWPTPNIALFQKVMNIRNTFAHSSTSRVYILNEDKEIIDKHLSLKSVSGSGALKRSKRSDLLIEFEDAFREIKRHLHEINKIQK